MKIKTFWKSLDLRKNKILNATVNEPVEDNEIYFKSFTVAGLTIDYGLTKCFVGASKRKSKERNQDGSVYLENTEDFDCIKQGEWWLVTEETSIDPSVDKPFVRIILLNKYK